MIPETKQEKVTANDTIIAMLSGINSDRRDVVYQAAEKYLNTLSPNGQAAYSIKRRLSEKPLQFTRLDNLDHSIKNLLITSDQKDEMVFVSDTAQLLIDGLKSEYRNKEALLYHNIPLRSRLLLHGPTGNGKTTLARHIAKEMGLPFVEIKADLVIDSKIGGSGENIHKIFTKINQPCILFWDEVDTIGRKRGGSQDSAAAVENDRMVNSILVNLEKLDKRVILIAATNRYDILDSAFLRRFDIIFDVPAPSYDDKTIFKDQLLSYHRVPVEIDVTKFDSLSDIKRAILDLARAHVLNNYNDPF